jgi:transcriptional regulator with XRE-family HTH domain
MQTAGWSQAETARRLHITPGAVSQICNGKTQPRAATLNLLKLMIPRGEEIFSRGTARHRLLPWEAALLSELRRLPRNRRDQLLVSIHQLIKLIA